MFCFYDNGQPSPDTQQYQHKFKSFEEKKQKAPGELLLRFKVHQMPITKHRIITNDDSRHMRELLYCVLAKERNVINVQAKEMLHGDVIKLSSSKRKTERFGSALITESLIMSQK